MINHSIKFILFLVFIFSTIYIIEKCNRSIDNISINTNQDQILYDKEAWIKPTAHVYVYRNGKYIDTKESFNIWHKCKIISLKDGFYIVRSIQPNYVDRAYIIRKRDIFIK